MATLSDALAYSIERTIDLHRITLRGEEDSSEYEEVCEELDSAWGALDEREAVWLRNLSGDFYVMEGHSSSRYLKSAAPAPHVRGESLCLAWQQGMWEEALELLRTDIGLERAQVAFLRGQAYLRMGVPQVAFEFAKDLYLTSPDDGNALLALDSAMSMPTRPDTIALGRQILVNTDRALFITASAALYLLRNLGQLAMPDRTAFLGEADRRLEEAARMHLLSPEGERSFATIMLGAIRSELGQSDIAAESYRKALDIHPSLEALELLASENEIGHLPEATQETVAFKRGASRFSDERSERILAHAALRKGTTSESTVMAR